MKEAMTDSLWTASQTKMITRGGHVRRYEDSPIIDFFPPGCIADISFPKGYNKGNRVYPICPTLNTTTTETSFIYKEEKRVENLKSLQNGPILGDPVQANEDEKRILNALKNRSKADLGRILDSLENLSTGLEFEVEDGQIYVNRYVICFDEGRWKLLKVCVRKLTENEAYRLMGFEDEAYQRCVEAGQAASTIFHQAGDSIVVTVLMGIFGEMTGIDYKSKIEELSNRLAAEKDVPLPERMKEVTARIRNSENRG